MINRLPKELNTKNFISSKEITQAVESDYYERCKKSETIVIEKASSKENCKNKNFKTSIFSFGLCDARALVLFEGCRCMSSCLEAEYVFFLQNFV